MIQANAMYRREDLEKIGIGPVALREARSHGVSVQIWAAVLVSRRGVDRLDQEP